jgi:hypothetical protein
MNIFRKLVEKRQGESDDRFLDMCIEVCEDNAGKFQLQVLGGTPEVHEHYMKMEARGCGRRRRNWRTELRRLWRRKRTVRISFESSDM